MAAVGGQWKAAECPFTVEYPAELMMRIRQRAMENFHTLPNGGLEVGGVLFGRVLPNARMMQRVELAAERPIACAHGSGPAFVLSPEEKAQAAVVTESGRWDRDVAGLSVVGFWVAHGRSELALTPDDVELYQQVFPHPWQVVLVLKPQADGVPTASFFFRGDGGVAPHRRGHEFFTDPNFTDVAEEEKAAAAAEIVAPGKYKPIRKERRTGVTAPVQESEAEAPRSREVEWRVVTAIVVASLLVGALLGYALRGLWKTGEMVKPQNPGLTLEVFDAGPELLVHWNAKSWEVDHARRAEMVVESGGVERPMALTTRDLVTGYLRVLPPEGDTTVTLRVFEDDGHTEEQQRFWIPGAAGTARKPKAAR